MGALAMISDAVINFFMGLVGALLSFLPTSEPPEWLTTIAGSVGTVYAYAGQMGAWFPVTLVRNIALAVIASILTGFVVKMVRIIASFATIGGGSAG